MSNWHVWMTYLTGTDLLWKQEWWLVHNNTANDCTTGAVNFPYLSGRFNKKLKISTKKWMKWKSELFIYNLLCAASLQDVDDRGSPQHPFSCSSSPNPPFCHPFTQAGQIGSPLLFPVPLICPGSVSFIHDRQKVWGHIAFL